MKMNYTKGRELMYKRGAIERRAGQGHPTTPPLHTKVYLMKRKRIKKDEQIFFINPICSIAPRQAKLAPPPGFFSEYVQPRWLFQG